MRNREGTVLTSASETDRLVKPEPPEDMWERLDQVIEQYRQELIPKPPEGSFTSYQFAIKKKCSNGNARKVLVALAAVGKVKVTKIGSKSYYQLLK